MEPAPATRPATPADCRKQARKDSGSCLLYLFVALIRSHFPFIPAWVMSLYFLAIALGSAKSAMRWHLLSRHMGQTVTYRIGPSGHTLWQRTVTYDIPQVPTMPKARPPASTIITLGWTLATGIMLLFAVSAFTHPTKANLWPGLLYAIIDVALFAYTAYNWNLVWQQRRRRTLSRTRNTAP